MRKRLAIWLCLALLTALLPFGGASAEVQTLTLGQLKAKYPHGAYWNHTAEGAEDYTTIPCNHHAGSCAYNGSCGCNTYRGRAIQCMGFAYQLASLAYGCEPSSEWTTNRSATALDSLKAGDIVRYRNNTHSIFVTAVEGNTVTFADCNWDGHCMIQWNRTVSKATLKASFTYVKAAPYALAAEPALTVSYDAGGGTIANAVVGHTYRVLSTNGINMRQDAGTDQTKLSALPHNTVFTVAVGDTKEAGDYLWGKTTYNGVTGWVVISDFVEMTGEVYGGAWNIVDGLVCRNGAPLTHAFLYGEPVGALCVPDEVGLYREGYRFAGWSTAADGSGIVFAQGMTPEQLCPDGGDTVTLYALWNPIVLGDADGNGRINNRDLGLLQRHLNGWEIPLCPEADMNGDGNVNNKDLGLLQRVINEWDTEDAFCCT